MSVKLKRLAEQVIVITGASSGIGRATAKMAAKRGARLVLAARSEDALLELEDEIVKEGGQATSVVADVSKQQDVSRIAQTAIKQLGGFDCWVNNAGVSIYGKLTDVPIEDQRRLFETNYWGVVYGSLMAVEHLKASGGSIINVGSTVSDRAMPLQGAYCASKHAIKGFTDSLRMELEHDEFPISVTLIKPGAIDTPYIEHAKNFMAMEPRFPSPVYAPEVVADTILYAAENPVRDLFAGGGGKALSLAGQYAPRLMDKLLETWGFETQQSDKPNLNPEENGLYHASGGGRSSGVHEGHVAKTSLYTKSSMHPFVSSGLLLAGAGVAYMLTRSGRSGTTATERRRRSQARSQPMPTA